MLTGRKEDKAIFVSLLQTDFYTFTVGWFAKKYYPDVNVTYRFKNRTPNTKLGLLLDMGELREHLDEAQKIRFAVGELQWLNGIFQYGRECMFPIEFIEFLRDLTFPEYHLEKSGDEILLEFSGPWPISIHWEIPALMIVNTLMNRARTKNMSRSELASVYATGTLNLAGKTKALKTHKEWCQIRHKPLLTFSDFGTRRCFSPEWQEYVVDMLKAEVPDQFRGTSNCYLAKKLDLMPMGTRSHQGDMIIAALANTEEELLSSPFKACDQWAETFGPGLYTHLTDTYSSPHFFKHAPSHLAKWKAIRQDSGDPYVYGELALKWYERHGEDPKTKILIPSDGLNLPLIIKLHKHFMPRISVSSGWGTNLTNDLGLPPASIVIKPHTVNGRGAVKLSDNISKAMGTPEDIETYNKAFKYSGTFDHACYY